MLALETRMEILGITVFQDADRPTQFYYLPGSPRITHERGEPQFDLFSYRKGGEAAAAIAGGFLNMTVDVGIGGVKDRIEQRLAERFGDGVTLAPVPFAKGAARVIALGEDSKALAGGVESETTASGAPLVAKGPRFIQNILGAGQPSLVGDNRAIFSFSLSEDGSAFFLNVLSGSVNARPVGVVYELEYIGLLPAYELEITIDFKSSYEYLRSRFTLGTLLFKADVDNITEELRRRESIKIKEVARTLELSTPEAVRERQNRIDQLVKDLATGALFQPSLTPGQPKVKEDTITAADPTTAVPASVAGPGASPALAAISRGPSAAVAAGLGESAGRAANPAGTPAGGSTPGGGAPGGTAPADGTQPGGGAPPGGTVAPAGGTATTPAAPPAESAADVWNRMGRPQAAFALKSIRQEELRTVTYNLTQVTAQKQTIAPQGFIQFLASPRDLNRHVHIVDLNHPFFQRININVNAANVDFAAEGITQMTVQLRYGTRPDGTGPKDTAEAILRRKEDSRDFTFFADRAQTQSYEYKLIADYRNDFGIGVRDARVESGWIRTEARSLSVSPRWLGRVMPVTAQLAPNLPEDVSEVHVRVRYVNAARHIDDSHLARLTPAKREETVHIRLADASEQFEVTSTLFYKDGTSEALPALRLPDPNTGTSDEAVVVSAPRANRLDGDVIMLDPIGELSTVLLDTQVLQNSGLVDSRSFELTIPGKRTAWSVRLPERGKPTTLRYKERRIYKDGGLEAEEWRDAVSTNLVVGIPAEGTLTVAVTYLGPKIGDLGLSALQLDLEYNDPRGDVRFAQKTSLLIVDDPKTHSQDWKVRLPDRQARTYRWRLTLLHANGNESSTPFREDTRERLILRPPQL
ncbi:MAG: hypothetical protein HY660_08730 [Armatimonadetes bacterium]|nr:hypothetical protein [Armatimonadota bacterium]